MLLLQAYFLFFTLFRCLSIRGRCRGWGGDVRVAEAEAEPLWRAGRGRALKDFRNYWRPAGGGFIIQSMDTAID